MVKNFKDYKNIQDTLKERGEYKLFKKGKQKAMYNKETNTVYKMDAIGTV